MLAICLFLAGLPFATSAADETNGAQATQIQPTAFPIDPVIGDDLISDEIIELEPITDPNDGKIVPPELPEADAGTLAISTTTDYYLAVKST